MVIWEKYTFIMKLFGKLTILYINKIYFEYSLPIPYNINK